MVVIAESAALTGKALRGRNFSNKRIDICGYYEFGDGL